MCLTGLLQTLHFSYNKYSKLSFIPGCGVLPMAYKGRLRQKAVPFLGVARNFHVLERVEISLVEVYMKW